MTVHRVGSVKVHEMTLCSPEAEERGSLNPLYDSKAFDSITRNKADDEASGRKAV